MVRLRLAMKRRREAPPRSLPARPMQAQPALVPMPAPRVGLAQSHAACTTRARRQRLWPRWQRQPAALPWSACPPAAQRLAAARHASSAQAEIPARQEVRRVAAAVAVAVAVAVVVVVVVAAVAVAVAVAAAAAVEQPRLQA